MSKTQSIETLTELAREAKKLQYRTEDTVLEARKAGASWTEIGAALGVSKQAAAQKYGERERQEIRHEQWERENPEKAAAIKAEATAETQKWIDDMHARLLAEAKPEARGALRAMWNMEPVEEAATLTADDSQGTSVTPSIFVDPLAPAKPRMTGGTSKKAKALDRLDATYEDERPGVWVASAGMINGTAQPGTGKGPHACPRCGSTNHKGSVDEIRAYPECRPTKYDPQDITDWLNARS